MAFVIGQGKEKEESGTFQKLKELEKRGITPVIIPDGDADHAPRSKE